jgi:type I restriction enzyme S subunit
VQIKLVSPIDIFDFKFNVPSIKEQQAIVNLSAIDDKWTTQRINKTLEEMAMALYRHWFVGFGPFQDEEFVESELGWFLREVKKTD